jgi:hypothetical protein
LARALGGAAVLESPAPVVLELVLLGTVPCDAGVVRAGTGAGWLPVVGVPEGAGAPAALASVRVLVLAAA